MWIGTRGSSYAAASLGDAVYGLRRAVGPMIMAAVLAVAAGAALTSRQAPRFEAEATLLIRAPTNPHAPAGRAALTGGFDADEAEIQNQMAVLRSERLMREVQAALLPQQGEGTALLDRLAAGLTVRRMGLSNVVKVIYSSSDAAEAARMANAITAVYLKDRVDAALSDASADRLLSRLEDIRRQARLATDAVRDGASPMAILGDADALVLDSAAVPTAPIAPQRGATLVFAALLGLLAPAWLMMTRNVSNPVLRTEQDLPRLLDMPCLGLVTLDRGGTPADARQTIARLLGRRLGVTAEQTIGVVCIGPGAEAGVAALAAVSAATGLHLAAIDHNASRREIGDRAALIVMVAAHRVTAKQARRLLARWRHLGVTPAGAVMLAPKRTVAARARSVSIGLERA